MATRYRLILSALVTAGILVNTSAQSPTPAPEGRVTSVFHDVQLLAENAAARPAIIDDRVDEGTALQTGNDSRSELTFADLTITRLGANTTFSFNKAGRSIRLDGGSILLYARKNSGGAEVVTKAVSVGITGTTVIIESQPINFDRLIVLEGDARFSLNDYPDESTVVRAGQVLNVKVGARKLPKPGRVDISRILSAHPLIKNFPPLPSLDLILAAMNPSALKPRPFGGVPGYAPTPPAPPPGPTTWPGYPRPVPTARPSPRRPSATPIPTEKPTPAATPTAKPTPRPIPKPTSTPHRPGYPPRPTPTPKKQWPPPPKKRPTATPTPTPGQVIR